MSNKVDFEFAKCSELDLEGLEFPCFITTDNGRSYDMIVIDCDYGDKINATYRLVSDNGYLQTAIHAETIEELFSIIQHYYNSNIKILDVKITGSIAR